MLDKRETEAVMKVMERGVLSGYRGNWSDDFYGGPEVKALEMEWAKYFGVKHAIACNSNSSGLWMACNAIGLNNNWDTKFSGSYKEQVIVTPYSMTISASVPLIFGAKPVFGDIEPDYFCLDPNDIERKITKNTKAIIVVDLFGQPCDIDAINEIAERKSNKYGHKIYVIEDAAQAPGAKYDGAFAGTLCDIGVFSLNFHKHIHCGEGGIVVTNDDELAMKLRLSMNHAEAVVHDMESKGGFLAGMKHSLCNMYGLNLRMTELSAAIAREQLKKLDGVLRKYRNDAKYFPVKVRPGCEHSFYRYAWTECSKKFTENKDIVKIHEKFNFKTGYIDPIFRMPLFRNMYYAQDQCPVVQEVNKKIVLAWQKESY
jgi:dTDP-4-amino-4,6-dideoxygalactose transaminase